LAALVANRIGQLILKARAVHRGKKNARAADEESEQQEEDNLMTDQQREEEAMCRHTFNFYLQQKNG